MSRKKAWPTHKKGLTDQEKMARELERRTKLLQTGDEDERAAYYPHSTGWRNWWRHGRRTTSTVVSGGGIETNRRTH